MYHFIVNPAARSGHGQEVWDKKICPVLKEKGIDYLVDFSSAKGEVTSLVNKVTSEHNASASDEALRLIIVGGDGTLNEAFQGVDDFSKVLIGYVPAGSANDFANNTGISQDQHEALAQILSCEKPTRYDVGYMTYNDAKENPEMRHYFSSSCGMGFDAEVSWAAMEPSRSKDLLNKLGMGSMIYLLMALKTLAGLKRGDCVLTLNDDKVVKLPNFLFVCSMIYRFEGGGFLFAPDANPSDGQFDVCVFGSMSKWKVILALPSAFKGTHFRYKNVDLYNAGKVNIKATKPFWIQLDGEVSSKSADITIVCNKEYLQLLK